MTIHYISPYVNNLMYADYLTTPSATSKIAYIKDVVKDCGYSISIFSPVCCKSNSYQFRKAVKLTIDDKETHYLPFSIGGNNRIVRILSYVIIYFQLLFYILIKVKRHEPVLLYHTLPETYVVKFIKRMVGFKLFLEVEEIYNAVYNQKKKIPSEISLISRGFDGYILVNNLMPRICNINKYYTVCEGQYKMFNDRCKSLKGLDNKIHVLYAGVFEENSDVFLAIETGRYLNSNYILHIAGYGNDEIVSLVERQIVEMNSANNGCPIVYHGCLLGEKYEEILNLCTVGLCPRKLDDELSNYTFPSKIFVYLSRNLNVVCTPITCVKNSSLHKDIVVARSSDSKDIAAAILGIKVCNINNTALLEKEHSRLKKSIIDLFENN